MTSCCVCSCTKCADSRHRRQHSLGHIHSNVLPLQLYLDVPCHSSDTVLWPECNCPGCSVGVVLYSHEPDCHWCGCLRLCQGTHLLPFARAFKGICLERHLPSGASAFRGICLQGHLPSGASAFRGICPQGHLPSRASACMGIYLQGHLPSSFRGICPWGHLPSRASACLVDRTQAHCISVVAVRTSSCPSVNSCHRAFSCLVDDVEVQSHIFMMGSFSSRRWHSSERLVCPSLQFFNSLFCNQRFDTNRDLTNSRFVRLLCQAFCSHGLAKKTSRQANVCVYHQYAYCCHGSVQTHPPQMLAWMLQQSLGIPCWNDG